MGWRQLLAWDDRHDLEEVFDHAYSWVYDAWHEAKFGAQRPAAEWRGPPDALVFRAPPLMPDADAAQWWTDGLERYWLANVKAFRSLARRLHGAEIAPAKIADAEADRRFRWHLARCQFVPLTAGRGPITADSYLGLDPSVPAPRPGEWDQIEPAGGPCPARGFALLLPDCTRWFVELVIDDLAPRCQRCGESFGRTATGKLSRRLLCSTCAFRQWEQDLSSEARRERWRRNKAQRRKNKGTRGSRPWVRQTTMRWVPPGA